jgi:hypothetical protein
MDTLTKEEEEELTELVPFEKLSNRYVKVGESYYKPEAIPSKRSQPQADGVNLDDLEVASGLKWRNADVAKSYQSGDNPMELKYEKLANALKKEKQKKFTKGTWETFGVTDLRMGNFIKSGESYFRPADKEEPDNKVTQIKALRRSAPKILSFERSNPEMHSVL